MRNTAKVIAPLVLLLGFQAATSPASAYCIVNEWKRTLHVKLKTHNPLGNFHRMIKPNEEACCEWFDRSCNPSASRNGKLIFDIRSKSKKPREFYCSTSLQKRVSGVGGGKITVRDNIAQIGGLECDSRDYLARPVDRTLPTNNYGVPIFKVPDQVSPPTEKEIPDAK
ncbi:MAG: hypothetical protein GKS01_06735 [Alphaproteobacteria bacterium]|nr:hypothetical protein [Alphaproteobacteria bacterium]